MLTLTDKPYIAFPFNYVHIQNYNTFHYSSDIVRNSLMFEPKPAMSLNLSARGLYVNSARTQKDLGS